jgi:16S rRNA (adenine1518-N6/adenine1519-N6)-dimethyltransferase
VLEQDALRIDWESQEWPTEKLILVSNLPYQISAPLVMELSSLKNPLFESMILMFQKEVAERITALPKTKDYGSLSVVAQNRWRMKKVVDAAPACFHPRPQIASRVLLFDRIEQGVDHPKFLKFVRQGFQNRRKLLIKSLKSIDAQFDWPRKLEDLGHSATVRAEELDPEDWKKLFHEYQNCRGQ